MKQYLVFFLAFFATIQLSAQTIDIPDEAFLEKLIEAGIDLNSNGSIQLNEALAVKELDVSKTDTLVNISFLDGIEAFENLEEFTCTGHFLLNNNLAFPENRKLKKLFLSEIGGGRKSIDLSYNGDIEELDLSLGNFESIDVSKNVKLRNFVCHGNMLESIDVTNNPNLLNLYCYDNELTKIDVSQNPILINFSCVNNSLYTMDLSSNRLLKSFSCGQNNLKELDLSMNDSLTSLYCYSNYIEELDLTNNFALKNLWCSINQIQELDLSNNLNLELLYCNRNPIGQLEITHLAKLEKLSCGRTEIKALDYSQNLELTLLNVEDLSLDSLDLTPHLHLRNLTCTSNDLEVLDLSNNLELVHLDCSRNLLSDLDLSDNTFLETLTCHNNSFEVLDFRHNPFLRELDCSVNLRLNDVYLKNGSIQDVNFIACNNLNNVCSDDFELDYMEHLLDSFHIRNVFVHSDCPTDIPDGFHQVIGRTNLEYENVKCEDRAKVIEVKYNIINDTFREIPLASYNGLYTTILKEGSYTIVPHIINAPYFDVEPDSINISLPEDGEVISTQFCVSAQVVVQDLNVSIYNINRPRPGQVGTYKIKVTNNGTTTESGEVELAFNDDRIQLILEEPMAMEVDAYGAVWSFEDLAPFETRTYCFSAQLNGPQDTPALNDRDMLKYYAVVTTDEPEAKSADNYAILCQTVRNSYDPNDKTGMQGAAIFEDRIGEYVFYKIRFENTGSADALDILIRDEIDPEKYAISTLQITDSSHPMDTKIVDENTIEFHFNDINLSFEEGQNTGFVVFKLRILDSLVVGDSFENSAEIYFDNNLPIITNTATTTIITEPVPIELGDKNFLLNIFPNPTSGTINITSSESIQELNVFDVQGRLVYKKAFVDEEVTELSTPEFDIGLYLVRVQTEAGFEVAKVVVDE